jgi:radical SAM superfamily enzyme YgiQ (UPF0313 family)
MKVLFIQPPVAFHKGYTLRFLSISYLSRMLQTSGILVDIMDCSFEDIAHNKIQQNNNIGNYDIICISAAAQQYAVVYALVRQLRQQNKKGLIVLGGPLSEAYRVLLNKCDIDVIVRGEGELVLSAIVSNFYCGDINVSNLSSFCIDRINNKLVISSPHVVHLDTLPFAGVVDFKSGVLSLSNSRGCPFKCSFCYNSFRGVAYRERNLEEVVEEICFNKKTKDINFITFSDELSFLHKKSLAEMSRQFIDKNLCSGWEASIRGDLLSNRDMDIVIEAKNSGLTTIFYSLESGSQAILNKANKRLSVNSFVDQTTLFRRAGIEVRTSVVFGLPGETEETINETIDVLAQCCLYPGSGYLLPTPGSDIYNNLVFDSIEDEHAYLLSMWGGRENFLINLSSMPSLDLVRCVNIGLNRLATMLKVDLLDENPMHVPFDFKNKCVPNYILQ